MRMGRPLEVLVSHLEKVLSVGTVKVESPKRLRDRVTNKLREHDVVLAVNQGHHQMTVALECRDHARPVDVSQVEAFNTKCQHTGVDVGIIVSTRGFSRGAQVKAEFIGVRCLTLEEATSFDWLLIPGLEIRKRRPIHLTITAKVDGVDLQGAEYSLVDSSGMPISVAQLQAEVLQHLRNVPWDSESERGASECVLIPHGIFALEISSGKRIPVESLTCQMDWQTIKSIAPFRLARYSDVTSGEEITQAAIADAKEAGLPGSIVISCPPGREGGVYFVEDKALAPSGRARKKSPNPAPAPDC